MNDDEFDRLCLDAGAELGLADTAALYTDGQAHIDGVDIAVLHDAEDHPDCVFSFADLGHIEPEWRAQIMERLLTLNFNSGSAMSGFCGLHQPSQRAVLCMQIDDASALDGADLAQLLREQAADATRLRAYVASPQIHPLDDTGLFPDRPTAPPSWLNQAFA